VDDATVALIARRARMWREFGVAARILDGAETRAATGTDFYTGGWIDPRGGQLQPLAYARELARVAAAQGARIFAQSPATRLERAGDGWAVAANGHAVRAASVLVCTNGYTDRLLPRLRRSYVAASSIICATTPLPAALRQQIMPSGMPISDARRLLNYMQIDPAGRFMIGARGSFGLHEPEPYFARLRRTAECIFPALRGVTWEDCWGGRFALTADHLPHLHNPAPGLYAVIGCNGRGVAMLSQLGRLVADLRSGAFTVEQSPVPVTPIAPIPFHSLRRIGLEAMGAWYRMLDRVGM
jgi:glycine/D-amino acid oxidase-like deaminating enzyme